MRILFRFIVNLLCIKALVFYPIVASAQSITVDGSAPSALQPGISNSGGKPLINITRPTNGVSVNRYATFSTNSGAIFNNSKSAGASQTAGSVAANTRIGSGAEARVILNDVRGSQRSNLAGSFEVFGKKADVVIANQNGITCNGCSFINSSRTTLSSGAPTVNANGDVILNVKTGNVHVGRSGATASGHLNLVGRTVTVDGPVQATVVDAIGGASTYNARTRAVGANAGTGAAGSTYAVDGTQFGAMTAGQIRIIGNENGLGVRTLGKLKSTSTDVSLHSKAGINHASVEAKRDFVVRGAAGSVQQDKGVVTAERNVDIRALNYAQAGTARIKATGDIKIDAGSAIMIAGEMVSSSATYNAVDRVINVGEIIASGDVEIVAGEVWNMRSDRRIVTLFAEGGAPDGCTLYCFDFGSLQILSSANWTDRAYMIGYGGVVAARNLSITSNKYDISNSGVLVAAQSLLLDAKRTVTQQALKGVYRTADSGGYLKTDITKAKSATVANQIAAMTGGTVRDIYNGVRNPLISGTRVFYGAKAHGIGSLTVKAGHHVQNLGGEFKSNGRVLLQTTHYDVNLRAHGRWSHNFSYGNNFDVIAARNINLAQAHFKADTGTLRIDARDGIAADQNSIDAATYRNLFIREMGDSFANTFTINTPGWVNIVSQGTLTGNRSITASSIYLRSTNGEVNQNFATRSTGQTKFVSSGNMRVKNSESSGDKLILESTAGNIYIQGNARATAIDIDAEHSVINGTSTMYAGAGGINIWAGSSITNEGGRIWSHGNIDLLAGRKRGGDITSSHTTTNALSGYIRSYGTTKNVRLDTDRGTIRLTNNGVVASGNVTLDASGDVWIQRSHVEGNIVALEARTNYIVNELGSLVKANLYDVNTRGGKHLYNRTGANIWAKRDIKANANIMFNHGQSLTAGRDIQLTLANRLENYNVGAQRAVLSSGRHLSITSAKGNVYNRTSDFTAGGNVAINAGVDRLQLWANAGLTTGGALNITAGESGSNYDGIYIDGVSLSATSITMNATGRVVLYPGSDITTTAGDLTITAGRRFHQLDSDLTSSAQLFVTSNGASITGSRSQSVNYMKYSSAGSAEIYDGYGRNPVLRSTTGSVDVISSASHIDTRNATIDAERFIMLNARNNLLLQTNTTVKARTLDATLKAGAGGHIYYRTGANVSSGRDVRMNSLNNIYIHGRTVAAARDIVSSSRAQVEIYNAGAARARLQAGRDITVNSTQGRILTRTSDWVANSGNISTNAGTHSVEFWDGSTVSTAGSFAARSGNWSGRGVRLIGMPITATSIHLGSGTGHILLDPGADLTATTGGITIDSTGRFYQRDADVIAPGSISITSNGAEIDGSILRSNNGAITLTSGSNVRLYDAYNRNPLIWAKGAITVASTTSHFENRGNINGGGAVSVTSRTNLHNEYSGIIRSRGAGVAVRSTHGNLYNRYAAVLDGQTTASARAATHIYNHGATMKARTVDLTVIAGGAIENHQWSTTRGLLQAGRHINAQAGTTHFWHHSSDMIAGGNISIGSTNSHVLAQVGATFTQGGTFTASSGSYDGYGVRLFGTPVMATSISLSSTSGYIQVEPAALTATVGNINVNAAGRFYQRNSDLMAKGAISIIANGYENDGSWTTANGGGITVTSGGSVDITDAYSRNPRLWAAGAISIASANSHFVNNGIVNGGGDVSISSRTNFHNDTNALIRSRSGSIALTSSHGNIYNRYSSTVDSKGGTTLKAVNIYNDGASVTAGGRIALTANNHVRAIDSGGVRSSLVAGTDPNLSTSGLFGSLRKSLMIRSGTSSVWVRRSDLTAGTTLSLVSENSSIHNEYAVLNAARSAYFQSKGEFRATGGSVVANGVTIDSEHHLYLLTGHRLTARNGSNDVSLEAIYDYLLRDSFVTAGRDIKLADARNVYIYDSDTHAKAGKVDYTARGEIRHRIEDTDDSRTTAGTDVRMVAGGFLQNYRAEIVAGNDVHLESTGANLSNNAADVRSGRDLTLMAKGNLQLHDTTSARDAALVSGRNMTISAGDTLYADAGFITSGHWARFKSRLTPRFYAQVYENLDALHFGVTVSQGSFASDFNIDSKGAIDIYARDGVTLKRGMRGDNWVRIKSGATGSITAGYLLRSDTKWLEVRGGGDITLGNAQAAGDATIESTGGSVINTYNISSSQNLAVKAHKDVIAQHSVATRRGAFRGAASVNMNAGRNMTMTNALVSSSGDIAMFAGQKELGSLSVETTLANLKAGVENRVVDNKTINMTVNYGGHINLVGAEIYGRGLVSAFAGAGGGGQYSTSAANINDAVIKTVVRGQNVRQHASTLRLADTDLIGLSSISQFAEREGGIIMDRGHIQTHNLRIEALQGANANATYRDLSAVTVGNRMVIDVAGVANLRANSITANIFDLTNTPQVILNGSVKNFSDNNLNITATNNLTVQGTSHRRNVNLMSLNGVLANTGHLRANRDIRLTSNRAEAGYNLRNDGVLEAANDVHLNARRGIDHGRIQARDVFVDSEIGIINGSGAIMATRNVNLEAHEITTRSLLAQNATINARTGSFSVRGWQDGDGTQFATGRNAYVLRAGNITGVIDTVVNGEATEMSYAELAADLDASGHSMFYVDADLEIDVQDDINVSQAALISGQGRLTLTAGKAVNLDDGHLEAFGNLNATSFEGFSANSTRLSGAQIMVTAGSSFVGNGVSFNSVADTSIFSAGGVALDSRLHTYLNQAHFDNVIGTLAGESWSNQRAGASGGGTREIVSNELSSVTAGTDLSINTLGSLLLGGVQAVVAGDVTLTSSANLVMTAPRSVIEFHTGSDREGTDLWDVRSHATSITAGGNFSALAGDNATIEGAVITADGSLDLAALNNVTFVAAQNIYGYNRRTYDRNIFRTKTTNHTIEGLFHFGTNLTSGGNLSVEAQTGDLITAGSRFESLGGDINLSATEGNILAGVFSDIDRSSYITSRSTLFGLISSTSSSLLERINTTGTSALAELDLTILSGGDTELVGAQLSAGGNLNLNVGGDLRVLAAISSEREEFFESRMGAILATTVTENSERETAVLTSLNSDGEINISVGGETLVTLYSQDGEASQTVSELYPEELAALTNLILLDEELLNEYFYEETRALSPAFTAVLSIALTAGYSSLLTGPLASTATASGLAQTVNGVTTLTNAGRAVAAFASSSTVGLANGAVSGDIDLGAILQNAALAAGTQFLTASINLRAAGDTTGADALAGSAGATTQAAEAFGNQTYLVLGGSWNSALTTGLFDGGQLTVANVLESAFDATLSAGINSAVTGSDFREGLTTSLVRSVVSLGLADAQHQIGDIFEGGANGGEGSVGHALLHGMAGCAAAELQGSNCAAGAAGGIAQSLYAGFVSDQNLSEAELGVATRNANLLGAVFGYVFSGGDPDNVSIGSQVAQSGFVNNYLYHAEAVELSENQEELEACRSGAQTCSPTRIAQLEENIVRLVVLDAARDRNYISACGPSLFSAPCQQVRDELDDVLASYNTADLQFTGGFLGLPAELFGTLDLGDLTTSEYAQVLTLRDQLLPNVPWDPAAFGVGLGAGFLLGANGVMATAAVREAARICGANTGCTAAVVTQMFGTEILAEFSGGAMVVTALDGTVLRRVAIDPPSITSRPGIDDLALFRAQLGLPPAGSAADRSTLAMIEVNGQQIYGINAHGQPVSGVNNISRGHAEIDALNQIQQRGIDVSGQELTLYVDRTPCAACGQNGGIRSMVEQLGLSQLTVIGPDGPLVIVPRS